MKSTKDQVFVLVTLDMLRNGINPSLLSLIDLKKYYLEYIFTFTNINETYKSYGDACLTLATKLLDKRTNEYVWGDYYHKVMDYDVSVNSLEGVIRLFAELIYLLNSPIESQMNFVLKNEKKLGYTPYLSSAITVTEGNPLYDYFKYVNPSSFDNGITNYTIKGKIPEEAKKEINYFYYRYIANLDYNPNRVNPKLLKKLF